MDKVATLREVPDSNRWMPEKQHSGSVLKTSNEFLRDKLGATFVIHVS